MKRWTHSKSFKAKNEAWENSICIALEIFENILGVCWTHLFKKTTNILHGCFRENAWNRPLRVKTNWRYPVRCHSYFVVVCLVYESLWSMYVFASSFLRPNLGNLSRKNMLKHHSVKYHIIHHYTLSTWNTSQWGLSNIKCWLFNPHSMEGSHAVPLHSIPPQRRLRWVSSPRCRHASM